MRTITDTNCFLPDGAPRKVEFSIELVYYG
jgi:hypothetical protein